MTLQFEAEAVEIEENDLNILSVGFYAEENYLMIQQRLDDEGAIYHIERDDQSFGNYGGVEKIELSRDQIKVQLNDDGKSALDCEGVKVDFETDDETFELLSEKLTFIFGSLLTVN